MKHDYNDITSRIKENPMWYDENGTPRYGEFHPNELPDIYATEAVLYRINCQGCDRSFSVAESRSAMSDLRNISYHTCKHLSPKENAEKAREIRESLSLELQIKSKTLHYGDPPNVGCCSGTTMNCMDIKVIGYWKKSENLMDWERIVEYDNYPLADFDEEDYLAEDAFLFMNEE